MELAEDVAEKVLDFIPGVDTVGAIQDDHDVHVSGAPCHEFQNICRLKKPQLHASLPQGVLVCVCECAATFCSWRDGLPRLEVITNRCTDASAEL